MKIDKVANSGNDEFYTPEYAVLPLLKYLKDSNILNPLNVWCPFDTEESNFVQVLDKSGYGVMPTHIKNGVDFFDDKETQVYLDSCDYIISNPPYSKKTEVLQRLFDLRMPFAMLVGVAGLFESQKRFEMFRDNDFEIMYFNRRVAYFKDYQEQKPSLNPPFSSVYICKNILPKQIIFEEINKKTL